MDKTKIIITGRSTLEGSVSISGAKNAALPELAATILSAGQFEFSAVPTVEDVKVMFRALVNIGAEGYFRGNRVKISIPRLKSGQAPKEIVKTSRASILMLGPLLARNGYADVSLPGGCPIGDRKINFHLEGLKKMGAQITIENEHIVAKTAGLKGIEYEFKSKTVTGTENLLMAATLAQGTTILRNSALEPEINDLISLLQKMGADITREDETTLVIKGKTGLDGAEHRVIPDRIEMGTYVIAGSFPGNRVTVTNTVPDYITSLLEVLKRIGINITVSDDSITVFANDKLLPAEIETKPFPGFPTDLQAQITTLLTQVEGVSRIKENIFNNRFRHTIELNKLGANIKLEETSSIIRGITRLRGGMIRATDLRASAALILGGIIAEGETVIENAHQLFRGYENMPLKLKNLGADIKVIGENHG